MKHYLLISILLISSTIFSQIDKDVYVFKNVKFDSLIVKSTYPDNFDIDRDIYTFKNGLKVNERFYLNDSLHSYSNYFHENRLLTKLVNHTQIYSYDSESDTVIGKFRKGFSHGEEYFYEKGNIRYIQFFDITEGIKEYKFAINHKYDSSNRLLEEVHINKHIGYQIDFQSNSKNIDSLYHKSNVETSFVKYEYDDENLKLIYFNKGVFSGYKLYIGGSDFPKEIKTYSNLDELLSHVIYERNQVGLVTSKQYKIKTGKSVWGGSIDYSEIDKIIYKYDKNGMPENVEYYQNEKLKMKSSFKYYAL